MYLYSTLDKAVESNPVTYCVVLKYHRLCRRAGESASWALCDLSLLQVYGFQLPPHSHHHHSPQPPPIHSHIHLRKMLGRRHTQTHTSYPPAPEQVSLPTHPSLPSWHLADLVTRHFLSFFHRSLSVLVSASLSLSLSLSQSFSAPYSLPLSLLRVFCFHQASH